MNEPWNLKSDAVREADSLPTFIIFCEDSVSEPVYFKFFETALIKINPIENQKNNLRNVINAINYCSDNGIIKDLKKMQGSEDLHIWCVYDMDKNAVPGTTSENNEFNLSIKTANDAGIEVAWSNDAFELWILLHFEDVLINDDYCHRNKYYERLTDIFKSMPVKNADLQKALKYHGFNYKGSLKSENNFRNIVRSEIVSKTNQAIDRAENLEELHVSASEKPFHQHCPCTKVHHLVRELIKYGKKSF